MIIIGRNIANLSTLNIKISVILSYEYDNLFTFFTKDHQKLFVKNLYECLFKYLKDSAKILFIPLISKGIIVNPTNLREAIDNNSKIHISNTTFNNSGNI
jgi:hypothetical protein